MTELKPCPFCENNRWIKKKGGVEYWYVCGGCGAITPYDLGESGAAEALNTRPIEDALRVENEKLKQRLAEIVERTSIVYDAPPKLHDLIYNIAGINMVATGVMDRLTEEYFEDEATRTDTQEEDA